MYRELDHPDDPAAAHQKIASQLVDVFRGDRESDADYRLTASPYNCAARRARAAAQQETASACSALP